MKNIKKIKLTVNSTIKEALSVIDKGAMQIAVVVDEEYKLLGTITDGDIRRGLLANLNLDDTIETIMFSEHLLYVKWKTQERRYWRLLLQKSFIRFLL